MPPERGFLGGCADAVPARCASVRGVLPERLQLTCLVQRVLLNKIRLPHVASLGGRVERGSLVTARSDWPKRGGANNEDEKDHSISHMDRRSACAHSWGGALGQG